MQFFLADDGRYYPVSAVESYQRTFGEGGATELLVSLNSSDARVKVTQYEAESLLHAGNPAVAAAPGFFYLGLDVGEYGKSIWLRPLVAWVVSLDDAPVPITANGARDGVSNDYAIVQPDGSVIEQSLEQYADLMSFAKAKAFSADEANAAISTWRRAIKPVV